MKGLFLIFVSLFLITNAQAQLLIGPKIGVQVVSAQFQKINDYSDSVRSYLKPGFNIGSVLNLKVNKQFSLQFELNYTLRGKHLETTFEEEIKNKASYHFIESPALLRYSLKKQKLRYFINAGPVLSYWLGGSGKIKAQSPFETEDDVLKYSVSFKDRGDGTEKIFFNDVNRFQIGVDFGFGVQLPVKKGQKMMIEARYNVGHTNYGKKNSVRNAIPEYNDNLESANSSFNISAAYVFEYAIHGWKKGKSATAK